MQQICLERNLNVSEKTPFVELLSTLQKWVLNENYKTIVQ